MNFIRGDRRTRLTPAHLEDLMRIKINGPNELEKFPAHKYAKKWVEAKHIRTDDPSNVKKTKKNLLPDDEEKLEFLPPSSLF